MERAEFWNLADGVPATVGAQTGFNIVGRVADPHLLRRLSYQVDGGRERPVAVNRNLAPESRLQRPGDFNIDTLDVADLGAASTVRLLIERADGSTEDHAVAFPVRRPAYARPELALDLAGVEHPQEVGQVVDGHWRVSTGGRGEPCLEIAPEDAGYDRIILFGSAGWTDGYEVTARLEPTRWMHFHHTLGLTFRWNQHRVGDGTWLPSQWRTGLAYYTPPHGLRLRYGVDVWVDATGRKHGDHVLRERTYSSRRVVADALWRRLRPRHPGIAQLAAGTQYRFRLQVSTDELALTVWPAGRREPRPQLRTANPGLIDAGSVGVLAHNVAVRLYDLQVRPLS